MTKRQNKVEVAVQYWTNLIKPHLQTEAKSLIDNLESRGIKNVKYLENEKRKVLENIDNKLKYFRIDLSEHIILNMPHWKFDLIQLSCVGTPIGALRLAMERAQIDPSYLNGKIIDMEITNQHIVVYNRKENKRVILFGNKDYEEKKGYNKHELEK